MGMAVEPQRSGLTACVLLLAAAAARPLPAQDFPRSVLRARFPPATALVEVPFRWELDKVLVEATVNDSQPLVFALDTGAYTSVLLKPEKLAGLGLELAAEERVQGAGPSLEGAARVAENVRLGLGGLRLEGARLLVMPEGGPEHLRRYPWDGVLGAQLFASAVVGIDWGKGRLRLERPEAFTAPEGAVEVPLEQQGAHVFVSGEVVIDGEPRPVRLVVDTGASQALALDPDKVAPPARRLRDAALGRGLGGALRGDIGRIDELRLGGIELAGVVTSFPCTTPDIVAVGSDGNLGMGVLRRFDVTFDYAGRRMLLEPLPGVADAFPFSTAGLGIEPWISADGAAVVEDVYAGSPAARAGIEIGDRILALDARPVRELGVDGVRERLRQAPGTRVRLELRRAGSAREVELELAPLL